MWETTMFDYIGEVKDFLNSNNINNAQIMFDNIFKQYVIFYYQN